MVVDWIKFKYEDGKIPAFGFDNGKLFWFALKNKKVVLGYCFNTGILKDSLHLVVTTSSRGDAYNLSSVDYYAEFKKPLHPSEVKII